MFRRYIQRDKGSPSIRPPIRPFHDRIVALMPLRWYRGPMCDRMWFPRLNLVRDSSPVVYMCSQPRNFGRHAAI